MRPPPAKKIVHCGRGALPSFEDGAKAFFDFKVESLDGDTVELLEDSRKQWPHGYGSPLELVFGKKFQLPVWEDCLKTMLVDEVN